MSDCPGSEDTGACTTDPEYIIYIYIYTPLCYIGVILNILNLVVFTRRTGKMKQTTFTFLKALALYDLTYCMICGPIGAVRCVPPSHSWELYWRSYYEVYVYLPVSNTFASASVYLTVAISVERFISIKYPAWSRSICVQSKAIACIVCCFVAGLGMNMPYFFEKAVDEEGHVIFTEFGSSPEVEMYSWVRLVLNKIVPIILVVVFNVMLVVTVIGSTKQNRSVVLPNTVQARRQYQQTRLTIMMISISAVFVVCHIMEPFAHSGLYKAAFGPCGVYTLAYKIIRVVVNTLEVFSFASNFIFYCIFNTEFLHILRLRICCCLLKKIGPAVSSDDGETSINTVGKPISGREKVYSTSSTLDQESRDG
jgi:hypothetical protein